MIIALARRPNLQAWTGRPEVVEPSGSRWLACAASASHPCLSPSSAASIYGFKKSFDHEWAADKKKQIQMVFRTTTFAVIFYQTLCSAFIQSHFNLRTNTVLHSRGFSIRTQANPSSLPGNRSNTSEQPKHSSLNVVGKGSLLDEFFLDTRIVRGGYAGPEWTTDPLGRSLMNPPVWHASTITFPSVAALKQALPTGGLYYGRLGTPTTWALEEAFAVLEGADNACAPHRCVRIHVKSTRARIPFEPSESMEHTRFS